MLQNTVTYITFFNNDRQEGNNWITAKRQLQTIKKVPENGF
jgi:hypothetical protein